METKLILTIEASFLALSQVPGQAQKQNQFRSGNSALGRASDHQAHLPFWQLLWGLDPTLVALGHAPCSRDWTCLSQTCNPQQHPCQTCSVSTFTEKTCLLWVPTKGLPGSRAGPGLPSWAQGGPGPEAWEWRTLGGVPPHTRGRQQTMGEAAQPAQAGK